MRRTLVAANWKMHGASATNAALVASILPQVPAAVDVLLLPPALYLSQVLNLCRGSRVAVGAQQIHPAAAGAYTGEISAEMVRDLGASHVLVGHSERRQLFAEDDAQVAARFVAAQRAGLVPILCVGETLQQREQGQAEAAVRSQLDAVLQQAGIQAFAQALVAYEPVWAIGTGRTAAPADAQAMHALIRARLAALDTGIADQVLLLYGGSVTDANAAGLFACADVDGALVGGASLDAEKFAGILQAAQAKSQT